MDNTKALYYIKFIGGASFGGAILMGKALFNTMG